MEMMEALQSRLLFNVITLGNSPATVNVIGATVYVSVSGKPTTSVAAVAPLVIRAGSKGDVINARFSSLAVRVEAGGGRDQIFGSIYDDDLRGGDGNDVIFGDQGNDLIQGGNHRDTLMGGYGDDLIYSNNPQRNSDTERDELYGNDVSNVPDYRQDTLIGRIEDLFGTDTYDRVLI
jgi:Ca2+-binding RTX toxin-like protein